MTKWGEYLAGKDLQAAARLIDLPEQRRGISVGPSIIVSNIANIEGSQ
jgi:hypothetical protein